MVYFSSHGKQDYLAVDYEEELFLIFGKESVGLPQHIIDKNIEKIYKIPIFNTHVRSLNLANSVSIVVYEGLRIIK